MYTKNPVTGRNETLVNTSMLKGALDGVTSKIAGKADKGALESLSAYAERVADSVADKADKAVVAAVSAYAEGLLPKDVYTPLVDAYVGLACKVADPDVLEGAAKMAYAADPVKYATSNPNRTDVAEVSESNYKTGNPIYDAVTAAASTGIIELPPLLRLKSTENSLYDTGEVPVAWKTELPSLTDGKCMFQNCKGLTSWDIELPNLTDGEEMFDYCQGLASWNVELPNLTEGQFMFEYASLTSWTTELPNLVNGYSMFSATSLTSFTVALPAIHSAAGMFYGCHLDIDSLRCIAEGINDVNGLSSGDHSITIGLSTEAFNHPDKQKYKDILNSKGWYVSFM